MSIEVGKNYRLFDETESPWAGAEVTILEILTPENSPFAKALGATFYDFEIVDKETFPAFDDPEDFDENSEYRGLAYAHELFPLDA